MRSPLAALENSCRRLARASDVRHDRLASCRRNLDRGRNAVKANVKRHPWWYDKVKRDLLSGGDFISNWSDKPGNLEYAVTAPKAGQYEFWVRANPVATKLSYQINGGPAVEIDLNRDPRESVNIADDGKPDLRFLAWEHVGKVTLKHGSNSVAFRMHSDNNNHGMLDCFVLANEPFEPHGIRKPGEAAKVAQSDKGWFAFDPKPRMPFLQPPALIFAR